VKLGHLPLTALPTVEGCPNSRVLEAVGAVELIALAALDSLHGYSVTKSARESRVNLLAPNNLARKRFTEVGGSNCLR